MGEVGWGGVGYELSHLGSRWYAYACYECKVFAPIVIK